MIKTEKWKKPKSDSPCTSCKQVPVYLSGLLDIVRSFILFFTFVPFKMYTPEESTKYSFCGHSSSNGLTIVSVGTPSIKIDTSH